MTLSPQQWHQRFTQQARWTQAVRQYLYEAAGIAAAQTLLEVGCGTGVITRELSEAGSGQVYGLDLDLQFLAQARQNSPGARLLRGDAHTLPFGAGNFDACLCHFLLLWVVDPRWVVEEMVRVTRPGGAVLVLAEPDYGGRIDYPYRLAQLGEWQQTALRRQGADPLVGRRLKEILTANGLQEVQAGILGAQWQQSPSPEEFDSEWQVLTADLAGRHSPAHLEELRQADQAAWQNGARILFVPTFYAWGRRAA